MLGGRELHILFIHGSEQSKHVFSKFPVSEKLILALNILYRDNRYLPDHQIIYMDDPLLQFLCSTLAVFYFGQLISHTRGPYFNQLHQVNRSVDLCIE